MMHSLSKLQNLAAEILHEATHQKVDHTEIGVQGSKGFSVTARQGDVETIEYNQDKSISITVYIGKRSGSSSISDTRPEAIRAAVEAARHIARFTDEDPYAGLADKEEL